VTRSFAFATTVRRERAFIPRRAAPRCGDAAAPLRARAAGFCLRACAWRWRAAAPAVAV